MALVGAHLVGLIATYGFGHPYVYGLVPFFHLDREANAPTWFASMLAFAGAVLFFFIWRFARQPSERTVAWLMLSAAVAFVSLDEFSQLHEGLIIPVRELLDLSGFLYFSWVVPYSILVLLFGLYLLRFIVQLDGDLRTPLIVAAVVFLVGAVGVELVGGRVYESLEERANLQYDLIVTLEESLELAGWVLLIRSQFLILRKRLPRTLVEIR